MHLVQQDWFREYGEEMLLVTAKGYPDFGTRRFLTILSRRYTHLPMFYIGDADPFGAEIFLTYLFGSTNQCIIENKDRCETLFNLIWVGPFISDLDRYP